MTTFRSLAIASLFVAATACGSADNATTVADPATATPTASADDGGGWIDGAPEWDAGAEDASGEEFSADASAAPAATDAASDTASDAAAVPDEGDLSTEGYAQDQPTLRAGSVDDNADFAGYLEYAERIAGLEISTRPFDATGRIVVTVTGSNGLPAAGVPVIVTVTVEGAGRSIGTVRTTANGTARFLPALYGAADISEFSFTVGEVTASAAPGGSAALNLSTPGGPAQGAVALDVLFLLDATGSMGDEIDRLKTTIDQVAKRVAAFETRPDVRFAFTLYRDEGDLFVSTTFDFTGDIDVFRTALLDVVADGGGDYPEAVEEGLAAALAEPAWRDPASTLQLIFLVGDAPPRLDRQVPVPYPDALVDAVARGIKVIPIASSESDDQAEAVFRQIALATGARFVFLSYGAAGAATGGSSDIASTDYEEMALDQLIVRLISEELAALTGSAPEPIGPIAPTTTATNPIGQ